MDALNIYRVGKNRLLDAYKAAQEIDSDVLVRIERTPAWIDSCIEELSLNRFKLFIAGQMNCGKSTLLNALLFGRIILPVYDSVMTSSITLIEHASQNPDVAGQEGFRVEFYSQDEWNQIRQQLDAVQDEGRAKAEFEKSVALARERGGVAPECIGSSARHIQGFAALPEYVTPVIARRQGIYTPYVKSVTLYVECPLLSDMVVVDTPGTNDPNEQRAKLTEDWIRKADAVVFVSYAGQAMSSEDINFIDRFMLHVPSTHRIIAVNKIDAVDSISELDSYLADLRNSDIEGIRQIFDERTPLVKVCALGGLIADYKGSLPDNLLADRERLEPIGFLQSQRHGLLDLRNVIEEHLVKNKGDYLLQAHQEKIFSTFELSHIDLATQLQSINGKMLSRSQSADVRAADRKRIKSEQERVTKLGEDFSHSIQKLVKEKNKTLNQEVSVLVSEAAKGVEGEVKKMRVGEIGNSFKWILHKYIEPAVAKYAEFVQETWNEIAEEVARHRDILGSELGKNGVLSSKMVSMSLDRSKFRNLSIAAEAAIITPDQCKSISENAQGFLKHALNGIFNSNFGVEGVKTQLVYECRNNLLDTLKKMAKEFIHLVQNAIGDFGGRISTDMQKELERMEGVLDALQHENERSEIEKSNDHEKKIALEAKLARLEDLRRRALG